MNNGFEVNWLVSEKGIDIVKDNPAVDKSILVPLQRWKKEGFTLKNLKEFFSILRQIRNEQYDIAIDTQMMFKSMLWLRLCGAKRTICFDKGKEFTPKLLLKEPLDVFANVNEDIYYPISKEEKNGGVYLEYIFPTFIADKDLNFVFSKK